MKKYILFAILFSVSIFAVNGQTIVVADVNLRNPEVMLIKNTRLTYSQISGKPYLNDSFALSKVYLTNKQLLEMQLRLDIFAEEIEILNKSQIYYLKKTGFDSITMNNEKLIYCAYKIKSKTYYSYFIVLAEGKYTLLQMKRIEFKEQDKAIPYAEMQPARFVRKPDIYFIKKGSESAIQISNKKDLRKAFPEIDQSAEMFIKNNHIRFLKPNDLILLTRFLNSTK